MASQKPPVSRRRKWQHATLGAGILALLLALADYAFYPLLPIGGKSFNRGQNGIWLRDLWWRGTETESVASLASRLQRNQIRWAYFHVRFIKKDGTLRFRGDEYSARAQKLNFELHARAPQIKSLAWIYIGNARGLTGVDLSQASTRAAIVHEVSWLTKNCGFDGVQFDYEICENGDTDFLKLLEETRPAIPHKTLCVATALWMPPSFGLLRRWSWSEEYFGEVAKRCDQMAVMAYDSGMVFPRHYVWLVRQQIGRVGRAAQKTNARCEILIGVPTYENGGHSHKARAENLKMALKAARGSTPTRNIIGLAIFADYTTDQTEWNLWREKWLR